MEIINQKSFDTIMLKNNNYYVPKHFKIWKDKQFIYFEHIDKKNSKGIMRYDISEYPIKYEYMGKRKYDITTIEKNFFRGFKLRHAWIREDIKNSEMPQNFRTAILTLIDMYDSRYYTSYYQRKYFFSQIFCYDYKFIFDTALQLGFNVVNVHRKNENLNYLGCLIKSMPKDVRSIMVDYRLPLSIEYVRDYYTHEDLFYALIRMIRDEKIHVETDFEHTYNQYDNNMYHLLNSFENIVKLIRLGYTLQALFRHFYNYIQIYEGIDDFDDYARNLYDYASMNEQMNISDYEKYPKYLQSKHNIIRNEFDNFKKEYKVEDFKNNINYNLNYQNNTFTILPPLTPDEVKDEGKQLSHCVGSYIDRICKGECQIYFMRLTNDLFTSLVTLEIRKGKFITQAKGKQNRGITDDERKFISEWAKVKELELHL